MKLRTAKFVMIPMWVLSHEEVRGDATRIAVYAGLRVVAWEHPDYEWRSVRAIASAVGDIIGMADETIRKHIAVLERIEAVHRDDDFVTIPDDPPELGRTLGRWGPSSGSEETQTANHTTNSLKEREENTTVGTTEASKKADLNKEHPDFHSFWDKYPCRKNKPKAIVVFNVALRDGASVQEIIEGLDSEIVGWRRAKRPQYAIPYPASWLNANGWENEPDVAERRGKPSSSEQQRQDALRQDRDAVEEALADGRRLDAWRHVLDRAAAREGTEWWPEAAERPKMRDAEVVASVFDVELEAAIMFLATRSAILDDGSMTTVSQRVRELTP